MHNDGVGRTQRHLISVVGGLAASATGYSICLGTLTRHCMATLSLPSGFCSIPPSQRSLPTILCKSPSHTPLPFTLLHPPLQLESLRSARMCMSTPTCTQVLPCPCVGCLPTLECKLHVGRDCVSSAHYYPQHLEQDQLYCRCSTKGVEYFLPGEVFPIRNSTCPTCFNVSLTLSPSSLCCRLLGMSELLLVSIKREKKVLVSGSTTIWGPPD